MRPFATHTNASSYGGRAIASSYCSVILAALIAIAGIFVGLGSSVWVLFLVTLVFVPAFGIASLWAGETASSIIKLIAVAWIALQSGYMIGLTCRDALAQLAARFSNAQSKRI